MRSLALALSCLASTPSMVVSRTLPLYDASHQFTRRSNTIQIAQEIASLISSNSTIITPLDAGWNDEQERYMQNVNPTVQLSVIPAEESDVQKIVQYANSLNISFYAVSRGHALTTSVGLFNGIEINLKALNKVQINPGNTTARFQGGAWSYEVIQDLWNQGYVTATGGCSCVSVIGPALGGGHGLQQGKHGLTMDHWVNLNVVLANGTAVSVNETNYPDLWWGMKGAGQNFGVVTSYDSYIWPDNFKQYWVKSYQFGGNTLEPLFETVEKFQGNGSLDTTWLATFGLFTMNTTISTTEATISWVFLYDGIPTDDAKQVLAPFDQLSPLSASEITVPYSIINDEVGGAVNGSLCAPNKTHVLGTANLLANNVTSMRQIYNLYNTKVSQHPRLNGTRVLMEGYAMKGVQSIASNSSAYPFRADNWLTYFDVRFDETDDPLLDFARDWRDETVALWHAGEPGRNPTAYVNYAAGYESLEARYGYEPWRLDRLRALKKQYDPENKFAWYNPIIPPGSN